MSDVEYYLLEKDGENSKCGVLDLGKCLDSDENSAGESTFSKESNNLPAKGESSEEKRSETNTTNVLGHKQESKSSDDQLLSFLSSEEGSPDMNPKRDAQSEKDGNVSKSPENLLKDLIDMNVGVGLSTESLRGNGVNSQRKNETTILKKTKDMSHSSSAENKHPNSTKIQDKVADNRANSKRVTEILDFCNTPSEIVAPSEMSFSALVESDDTAKTTSQSSQLQNQDIEMAEIWSGANTEKVKKNGTMSQGMKMKALKESKEAAAIIEEGMETEEDTGNKIYSSEDSNESDSSGKSKESTEISANRNERTKNESKVIEADVDDKENEDMETSENEVEDTKMEEDVISVQGVVSEKKTVVKNTKLEKNAAKSAAADNRREERDLGSSSKVDFEKVKSTAMDTEEKVANNEESKGKGVETQKEGNVGELNSEDPEEDLADDAAGLPEKSANLIEKETNISGETKSNLAYDRNSKEKFKSLTNKGKSLKNKKAKIHDGPEDVGEEETEKGKTKANAEEDVDQSIEQMRLKGNEKMSTIDDKDSTDEAKEKNLEKLDDAGNLKNLQVTSRNSEAVDESASKTNSNEKSPSKETTISETEKEIFEGPKPKSVKARPKLPLKSAEDVTLPKGKSKADDGNPAVVSTGKQSNTDDGFVDYDEESIENITKTIKSFTSESSSEKKQDKRNDSSKKADSSPSKQVIVVETSSNVERVKRKLEEILEKSKGEEDAAIAELQRMKREKTDILNAITTEMEKLKAILVKGKQG